MFRIFLLSLLLGFASVASADKVGFIWEYPVAQQTQIDGFELLCGNATGVYSTTPAATVTPGTTLTVANVVFPANSNNFCVVRAFKGAEKSAYSNEVNFVARPDAPTNLRVTVTLGWDDERGTYVVRFASVRELK